MFCTSQIANRSHSPINITMKLLNILLFFGWAQKRVLYFMDEAHHSVDIYDLPHDSYLSKFNHSQKVFVNDND